MADTITTIGSLKEAVQNFASERHWNPYHTPKNLCMALSVECAELMEHFQWLTPEESILSCSDPLKREGIADELADVFNLLLQFSYHSKIDLSEALRDKMIKNAIKYPVPK